MYKINELAQISGISTRTLRHYDEIGLLIPSRNQSTYREYSENDLDLLQTILFYKKLGYSLHEIKELLQKDSFQIISSLEKLYIELETQIEKEFILLKSIKQTIQSKKGEYNMTSKEKFEALKNQKVKENDRLYKDELNQKYDTEFVSKSNEKYRNKSKYEMKQQEQLNNELNAIMKEAILQNDPTSELAKKMCELHKEWIMFYWPSYSKEAHLSLVKMYTKDDRFRKYYDQIHIGLSDFLFEAMKQYLK